jgi:MEMO1 family protein
MLKANLAGICYPAERQEVLQYVRNWFDQPRAARWDEKTTADGVAFKGLICPHIDFRVNTAVYSHGFAPWLKAPAADKVLILGVGHHARQEWSFDGRGYETPLGEVATDKAGLELLTRKLPKQLWGDGQAHEKEHSIEFPLVALQALRELRGIDKPFEYIPLLCGGLFQYLAMGTLPPKDAPVYRIADALREWWQACEAAGQRVEIVVSIDGCHIGPRFDHDYAVDKACLADARQWEDSLWSLVEKGDFEGFFKFLFIDHNARYFDGVGALALVMALFGEKAGVRRTGYAQWFEKSDTSVVTFSSGVIQAA